MAMRQSRTLAQKQRGSLLSCSTLKIPRTKLQRGSDVSQLDGRQLFKTECTGVSNPCDTGLQEGNKLQLYSLLDAGNSQLEFQRPVRQLCYP